MTEKGKLFAYPEQRVLEDAAHARGAWPTRIFAVLLPVWSVTVQATVTEAEDYDLIDRFLERGLAEAGLSTAAELADFFMLDKAHVTGALRYLTAIGHVQESAGSWTLTELGRRSVREQKRYLITSQDRRVLHFDGFGSRPLPRAYYESRRVTLLTGAEVAARTAGSPGPVFYRLPFGPFRKEALRELTAMPDREQFNLPEAIDEPRSLEERLAHLPLYLVRTVDEAKRVRWLAYGQVNERADEYLTGLIGQQTSILAALENDERAGARDDEDRATAWLRRMGLAAARPVRQANGTWRVTLPGSAFGATGKVPLSRLGSFVVQGNSFFHLWCAAEDKRRAAALERMDSYLGARVRPDRADLERQLALVARQLRLGPLDLDAFRRLADDAGRRSLAARLADLT